MGEVSSRDFPLKKHFKTYSHVDDLYTPPIPMYERYKVPIFWLFFFVDDLKRWLSSAIRGHSKNDICITSPASVPEVAMYANFYFDDLNILSTSVYVRS